MIGTACDAGWGEFLETRIRRPAAERDRGTARAVVTADREVFEKTPLAPMLQKHSAPAARAA
jgi:hypothetical protein